MGETATVAGSTVLLDRYKRPYFDPNPKPRESKSAKST